MYTVQFVTYSFYSVMCVSVTKTVVEPVDAIVITIIIKKLSSLQRLLRTASVNSQI